MTGTGAEVEDGAKLAFDVLASRQRLSAAQPDESRHTHHQSFHHPISDLVPDIVNGPTSASAIKDRDTVSLQTLCRSVEDLIGTQGRYSRPRATTQRSTPCG